MASFFRVMKESLIDFWRRRVSFSGFKTQIKHPLNTITQFLLSPFHHKFEQKHIANPALSNFILLGNP